MLCTAYRKGKKEIIGEENERRRRRIEVEESEALK